MQEILWRVLIGGAAVSAFAILGDLLKPKSFAGLFGAAPSVALASLAMAVRQHGRVYASLEARSMILGALAFFIYSSLVSRILIRGKWAALPVTGVLLTVWLASAAGLWYLLLGKNL